MNLRCLFLGQHSSKPLFLASAAILSAVCHAQIGIMGWSGHGGNSHHTALAPFPVQQMLRIRWSHPVDLDPQYSGNNLLIHYGSPLVTPNNTVVMTVKTGANEGFRTEGRNGYTGDLLWTQPTDYILPDHNWGPPVGCTLFEGNSVASPGAGGTVYLRQNADREPSNVSQVCFYGLANYLAAKTTYDEQVKIVTPITADAQGNLYFGFRVYGATPLNLVSGLAKIRPNGTAIYVSAAQAANDPGIDHPFLNCAPALSNDESVLYIAVTGDKHLLIGVSTTDLSPVSKVQPIDPKTGNPALGTGDSTATPLVAPDGDVYYGMFDNPFSYTHLRGYLLHFTANLDQVGVPGAFGWDCTPSIVPASAVPSYHGTSNYLLFNKYNNYLEGGGDGSNKIAILDPNDSQLDPIDDTLVMKEVLTKVGPTPDPRGGFVEWCISTAAIDVANKSAVVNSEDGKCYRWNFVTNELQEVVTLTSGIGEAYTPTIAGPDGTGYAINNGILFALGDNTVLPATYSLTRGKLLSGGLFDLMYDDNARLAVKVGLVANIMEAPIQINVGATGFDTLSNPNASLEFTVKSQTTTANISQKIEMYNYQTQAFEVVDTRSVGTAESVTHIVISTNAQRFVNPATKAMSVRLSYKQSGPVAIIGWSAKVNLVAWTTNP